MKIKLLVAALTLSLMACVEQETKDTPPVQEVSTTESISLTSSKPVFDFEHTYDETNGKQQFSREVTEEEKARYFNNLLDIFDSRISGQMRFNRKLEEPVLDAAELKVREVKIRKLLDQCVKLIGPQQMDNANLKKTEGVITIASFHTSDREYLARVQPLYLSGRMLKCINYLYFDDYLNKRYQLSPDQLKKEQLKSMEIREKSAYYESIYNFSNFAYSKLDAQRPADFIKREKIEKLYEQIYLEVKSAGLLRQVFYTYYPKSFLREHADQTGLTQFIHEKEAKAGKKLKHDELATEFFGSREKWIESFDQFLDQKMINQKIETQVASQAAKAA